MNSIVAVSSKLQIDLLSFQGLQSFTPLEDGFNLLVDRIGPSGLGVAVVKIWRDVTKSTYL